jgi:uncharacterized protein YxjI
MKYSIKQKFFSLADSFTIKDDRGNDAFIVKGKFFSFRKKLRFMDMSDKELCLIQQRLFKLLPQYDISMGGEPRINVRKRFALFRNKFTITATDETYAAEGNFLGLEFSIVKSDREVARISKKFFALTDTYGVETAEGEDVVPLLAIAVVIDMVCHGRKGSG